MNIASLGEHKIPETGVIVSATDESFIVSDDNVRADNQKYFTALNM
jgi:hypothetical protein